MSHPLILLLACVLGLELGLAREELVVVLITGGRSLLVKLEARPGFVADIWVAGVCGRVSGPCSSGGGSLVCGSGWHVCVPPFGGGGFWV